MDIVNAVKPKKVTNTGQENIMIIGLNDWRLRYAI